MSSNLLLKYLNNRFIETEIIKKNQEPISKPVITISREVGCNGVKLAHLLAEKLNKKNPPVKWRVISKEVFFESARELDMNPDALRKALSQREKFHFEEIIKAFNDKKYKSGPTIAKTTREVIMHFATDGYCIIVGRAGNIIAKELKSALHVRLTAPMDYRVDTIKENNALTHEKAIGFINRVEEERIAFRESVLGEKIHEELFDVTLNCGVFSNEAIVELIEFAAEKKGIFK
jgi:cytidylate kinase